MIKGLESKRHIKLNQQLQSFNDLRYVIIKYDEYFEGKVDIKIDIFRKGGKKSISGKISNQSVKFMKVLSEDRVAIVMENDCDIKIINLRDENRDFTLKGHKDDINHLCIVSNNLIVSSADDNLVILWDLEKGRGLVLLQDQRVNNLTFISNILVFTTHFNDIIIYNIESRKIIHQLNLRLRVTSLIAISSTKIVTGHNNLIKLWDITTMKEESRNNIGDIVTNTFNIPKSESILVVTEKSIDIIDLKNKLYLYSNQLISFHVTDGVLFSENKIILSSLQGNLKMLNYETYTEEVFFESGFIRAVDTLSDKRIISGGWDRYLKIWS